MKKNKAKKLSVKQTLAISVLSVALLALAFSLYSYKTHRSQPVAKVTPTASKPPKPYTPPAPPTRAELLALVNQERARNGVAPLAESPLLDQSAQWKADDETNNHYFGHVKPGTTGNDGLDYLNSIDHHCSYVSENITENTHVNDSSHAVNAWIASPPHHQAMIDAKYSITGFGISGLNVVEHFCQTS